MGLRASASASNFDVWCQVNPGGTWAQFMIVLQGAIGPQGSTGAQGTTGDAGAQGAQGNVGSTGAAGATGATGAQGIPGVDAAQTQAFRVSTASTGLYTWTYATPYAAGVVPVIEATCEGPDPQAGAIVNAQVEGTPTNTSCKIRVNRSTTTIQVLGINVLSLVTPVATVVHLTARVPS